MPSAYIYFRSDGSTFSGYTNNTLRSATYPDPNSDFATWSANMPSSQVLEFNFPDNILEGINYEYANNVIDIPIANSDGTKKIAKQENGLRSLQVTINGVFKNPKVINTDISKLKNFAKLSQVDDNNIYGIIGFYSPNAPEFSLDPDSTSAGAKGTVGFTLNSFSLGFNTPAITRYGFRVTLSFGGVFTNPLP